MQVYYTINLQSTDIVTGVCISRYWYFRSFKKMYSHFANEISGIRELTHDQRVEIIVDMNECIKEKNIPWEFDVKMASKKQNLCYIIAHNSLFQEPKQKQD